MTTTTETNTGRNADDLARQINAAWHAGAEIRINGRPAARRRSGPAVTWTNGTLGVDVKPRKPSTGNGTIWVKAGQSFELEITELVAR